MIHSIISFSCEDRHQKVRVLDNFLELHQAQMIHLGHDLTSVSYTLEFSGGLHTRAQVPSPNILTHTSLPTSLNTGIFFFF